MPRTGNRQWQCPSSEGCARRCLWQVNPPPTYNGGARGGTMISISLLSGVGPWTATRIGTVLPILATYFALRVGAVGFRNSNDLNAVHGVHHRRGDPRRSRACQLMAMGFRACSPMDSHSQNSHTLVVSYWSTSTSACRVRPRAR
jgi:hypothetical protein